VTDSISKIEVASITSKTLRKRPIIASTFKVAEHNQSEAQLKDKLKTVMKSGESIEYLRECLLEKFREDKKEAEKGKEIATIRLEKARNDVMEAVKASEEAKRNLYALCDDFTIQKTHYGDDTIFKKKHHVEFSDITFPAIKSAILDRVNLRTTYDKSVDALYDARGTFNEGAHPVGGDRINDTDRYFAALKGRDYALMDHMRPYEQCLRKAMGHAFKSELIYKELFNFTIKPPKMKSDILDIDEYKTAVKKFDEDTAKYLSLMKGLYDDVDNTTKMLERAKQEEKGSLHMHQQAECKSISVEKEVKRVIDEVKRDIEREKIQLEEEKIKLEEEKRKLEKPTVDEYRNSLGLDYGGLMMVEATRYQENQRVRHTINGDVEIYVFSPNGKLSGFFYLEGGPHSGSILRWSLWNHYFKLYGVEWYQKMIAGNYSNVEIESGGKWHPMSKDSILLNPMSHPPPKVLPSYPNGRPGDVCMNPWNYTR